jgi:hypothetical protein
MGEEVEKNPQVLEDIIAFQAKFRAFDDNNWKSICAVLMLPANVQA